MVNKIIHGVWCFIGCLCMLTTFWELSVFTVYGEYKFYHGFLAAVAFVLSIWFTMRMAEYAGGQRK